MIQIKLPELGEGIESATVAELHCVVGKAIKKEDDLLEVVTDKATFNISADEDGVVERIYVQIGDQPKVGDCLITLKQ